VEDWTGDGMDVRASEGEESGEGKVSVRVTRYNKCAGAQCVE
jgi:hypothetical protein